LTGEHHFFVHTEDVEPDKVAEETGWKGMDIRWLVSELNTTVENACWFRAVFPPGAEHRKHRHTDAEEIFYVIRGRGASGLGDNPSQEVEMGPGDCGFVPKDTTHWFRNLSDTEPVEAVGVYAGPGVTSLEKSGYKFMGTLQPEDKKITKRY
jgi:mannose-6-phosphate isomerase-like protein (cupin superfamily)